MPLCKEDFLSDLAAVAEADIESLNKAERAQALKVAGKLYQRLETPWDVVGRMMMVEPANIMAAKVAIDLGLFESLSNRAPETASSAHLASANSANPTLVKRILRHLAALGFIREHDADVYAANDFTATLATPAASGALTFLIEVQFPHSLKVPEYLRQQGFPDPIDPKACPWQHSMCTPDAFFDWLGKRPDQVERFGGWLKGVVSSWIPWPEYYATDALFQEDDPQTPFLVDVGGGMGHDVQSLLTKHHFLAGRLVLQDRPEVIAIAPVDEMQITKMAHDFFQEQPVKHARIYFLHSVLHDWPDAEAREILLRLVPAMRKGYSRILLNEWSIELKGASPRSTAVDLVMMSLVAARERDEAAWEALLRSAGLRIVRVWRSPMGGQGVIEVDLAD